MVCICWLSYANVLCILSALGDEVNKDCLKMRKSKWPLPFFSCTVIFKNNMNNCNWFCCIYSLEFINRYSFVSYSPYYFRQYLSPAKQDIITSTTKRLWCSTDMQKIKINRGSSHQMRTLLANFPSPALWHLWKRANCTQISLFYCNLSLPMPVRKDWLTESWLALSPKETVRF